MSAEPPDHCPVCARDLRACPPPNHCPGCGFEYDEHTRVWRSGESWARLALVYTAGGLVLGLIVTVLYHFGFETAPFPTLPLVCALAAPALGLFLRRLVSGRITGRFVALTPAGILIGTRPQPTLVPWADFEQLTEERGVPKLRRRGSGLLLALDDIFAGPDELADFHTAVRRAARDHRRQSGADGVSG